MDAGAKSLADYQNYIFDVDGTLYFSRPVVRKMVFRMLFYYGVRPWRWGDLAEFVRFAKYEKREKVVTPAPVVLDWLITRPCKLMYKHRDERLVDFVKSQHDAGKKIFVYSNFPTEEKVEALGLTQYVDRQFYPDGNDIVTLKPNPAGMEYIIAQTGISVDNTVFVGDREETDGAAARGVGMDSIILSDKAKKRAYIYESK